MMKRIVVITLSSFILLGCAVNELKNETIDIVEKYDESKSYSTNDASFNILKVDRVDHYKPMVSSESYVKEDGFEYIDVTMYMHLNPTVEPLDNLDFIFEINNKEYEASYNLEIDMRFLAPLDLTRVFYESADLTLLHVYTKIPDNLEIDQMVLKNKNQKYEIAYPYNNYMLVTLSEGSELNLMNAKQKESLDAKYHGVNFFDEIEYKDSKNTYTYTSNEEETYLSIEFEIDNFNNWTDLSNLISVDQGELELTNPFILNYLEDDGEWYSVNDINSYNLNGKRMRYVGRVEKNSIPDDIKIILWKDLFLIELD